jgi:hypothetical protein
VALTDQLRQGLRAHALGERLVRAALLRAFLEEVHYSNPRRFPFTL